MRANAQCNPGLGYLRYARSDDLGNGDAPILAIIAREAEEGLMRIMCVVLLLLLAGCEHTSRQTFAGPKAIIVWPKVEGADGGFFTCKGGEMWREGTRYALRFETRYEGGSHIVELHGVEKIMLEDDRVLSDICRQADRQNPVNKAQ